MTSYFGSFARAVVQQSGLVSFAAALGAVGFAALIFAGWGWIAVVATLACAVAGYAADVAGHRTLTVDPVRGVRYLEAGILTPLAAAVLAGGLLIVLSVRFQPAETAAADVKGLATAAIAAITGVLTALFIKGAEDPDGSWIGDRVKDAFETAFADCFPPESDGAQAVFSEPYGSASGWGWKARDTRAQAVKANLPCADTSASATPTTVR